MSFMILDTSGNAIDSFSDGREALSALAAIAKQDASAVDDLVVLEFDADGMAIGDAITVADLDPQLAMHVSIQMGTSAAPTQGLTAFNGRRWREAGHAARSSNALTSA